MFPAMKCGRSVGDDWNAPGLAAFIGSSKALTACRCKNMHLNANLQDDRKQYMDTVIPAVLNSLVDQVGRLLVYHRQLLLPFPFS